MPVNKSKNQPNHQADSQRVKNVDCKIQKLLKSPNQNYNSICIADGMLQTLIERLNEHIFN